MISTLQEKNFFNISLFAIISTIVVSYILLLNSNGEDIYPLYYGLFCLPFLLGYFYIILISKEQLKFQWIILTFLAIKFALLFIGFQNISLSTVVFGLHETGDANGFHIPRALRIGSFDELFAQLSFYIPGRSYNEYTGRATRVVVFTSIEFLKYFNIDHLNYHNIAKVIYVFNMMINILTLYFVYKAALIFSKSTLFAQRAVFFLAFNPFFISVAGAVRKESLLMFALSLFLVYIVSEKKNFLLLMIPMIIVAYDRVYMVPLLGFIVFYFTKRVWLKVAIVIVGVLFIENFIGIKKCYDIFVSYKSSMMNIGTSYLGNNAEWYVNILRALFAPAFIRNLNIDYFNGLMFSFIYSGVLLYFYAIALRSLTIYKGILSILLITYVFCFIFVPFQSTFKIMVIMMFATLFLDKVSFVRYMNDKK